MKDKIIALGRELGADIVGFAPIHRFGEDSNVTRILPSTKTVIGLAFRVLRGFYRGIEEGTTYYQYTTMGVETMEETVMPMASLRISMLLEEAGYVALPQRRHQTVMAEKDSTNPEVAYDAIYRDKPTELQLDFPATAQLCGLGEIGFDGALLTDDFGPFVRYCFILTDAVLPETPLIKPHLCNHCGKCATACPGHAIGKDGDLNRWQCAAYYIGANGKKNPFMPPDAYAELENRIDIIAGMAGLTPERAREVIRQTIFYPPAQHSYPCSICGRACDIACYMHLEEKGVLNKTFRTPFRKRPEWEFSIEDYEKKDK